MGLFDSIRSAFSLPTDSANVEAERNVGTPTSSNGASSHHLFWRLPEVAEPIVEATVEIRVAEPPSVDRLYFWALQASFAEHGLVSGAGHFGLQHHPSYPDGGAVNWGGYFSAASGRSGELPGSPLAVPSTLDNPNTGDYRWSVDSIYRYRIARADPGAWAGSITDLASGDELLLRHLYCVGTGLRDLIVWTEAFADCDAPGTAVHWNNPRAITASGEVVEPIGALVNYQSVADGGCSTSDSVVGADGAWIQRTGVARGTPQGSVLARPGGSISGG